MIDKNVIKTAVNEWLAKGEYYLVDVEMTSDDRIVIEIDHADGVWIEDCADLSRFLQDKLGEELGEYELEVGSAGIGQPFKVIEQYPIHIDADKHYDDIEKELKYLRQIILPYIIKQLALNEQINLKTLFKKSCTGGCSGCGGCR
jgi:hypothetical protein